MTRHRTLQKKNRDGLVCPLDGGRPYMCYSARRHGYRNRLGDLSDRPSVFPHQSPQQDVLDVSPSIDESKYEDGFLFVAVEHTPWRKHHFPISIDSLALKFWYDAARPRLPRKLAHGVIHVLDKCRRGTRRILCEIHGNVGKIIGGRDSPAYWTHCRSIAFIAALITSSWESVFPVSTLCSLCERTFRIPMASIISW